MEVEPMHVPPDNILTEELEALIMVSIQTLLNAEIRNVEKMKLSSWLTIHLRQEFEGRF